MASHEIFQKLLDVEQKVRYENVDDAMKDVDELFAKLSPPPISTGNLEYFARSVSPVRALLWYALAAQRLEVSEVGRQANKRSEYCIYNMFHIIKSLCEATADAKTSSLARFMVNLIIKAYDMAFANSQGILNSQIQGSAFSANFVALSCICIKDYTTGIQVCNKSIDMLKDTEYYEELAYLHQNAGTCYLGIGDHATAKQCFEKASKTASLMPDTIPNGNKAKLQTKIATSFTKRH